jgi:hypothetical protein
VVLSLQLHPTSCSDPFQIIRHFSFSLYISFTIYLDFSVYSVFKCIAKAMCKFKKKTKKSYNLELIIVDYSFCFKL